MKNKLKEEEVVKVLQAWNGKENQPLKDFYEKGEFENLIGSLNNIGLDRADLRPQITWLFKHHLENGGSIPENDQKIIISEILPGSDWATQLHVFQILEYFSEIGEEEITIIKAEAEEGIKGKNKFLRAWSYQALYFVSMGVPEFQEELKFKCEQAMEIESPSVRVRIREIKKLLEKLS